MKDETDGPIFAAMILNPADVDLLKTRGALYVGSPKWQNIGATGEFIYAGSKPIRSLLVEPNGSFTICLSDEMLVDLVQDDNTFTIDHDYAILRLRYAANAMEADLKLTQCLAELQHRYNAKLVVTDSRPITERLPSLN
jgi:hypothetical protein